jgi:hypothetical protein
MRFPLSRPAKIPHNPTASKKARKNRFDPTAPCCECGSTEHQLAGHPNPNTPEGYLQGCLPCNTKDHSFDQCTKFTRREKKGSLYHYYRMGRHGLCPGEWHGDSREISDRHGNYSLSPMPLTPGFAFRNLYPNEKTFKLPHKGGQQKIIVDPFWSSDQAWMNVGYFSNPLTRTAAGALKIWKLDTETRHAGIQDDIIKKYNDRVESAPTLKQLANFSSISSYPDPPPTVLSLSSTQSSAPQMLATVAPSRSFAQVYLDDHIHEHDHTMRKPSLPPSTDYRRYHDPSRRFRSPESMVLRGSGNNISTSRYPERDVRPRSPCRTCRTIHTGRQCPR